MDEELMWKGFYDKLQEIKVNPPTEHESRLQDADGGFFEKFGSLLRQKSALEDTNLEVKFAPFQEEEEENIEEECLTKTDGQVLSIEEVPQDIKAYDDERALDINDTKERKEEIIEKAFGMNIEDLYEEIIFEIYNNIGCESNDICTDTLIDFIQEAFKIPIEKHEEIVEIAQKKEPPKIRLNVEIIKAENLLPKDPNGLSDPFVTLFLESNGSHRYNSSVKPATLNPTWEEHFSLPIAENPRNEVLIVEVWDFDAAETVKEKVNKLFDVKGVKGLSKLMKEIAMTASTGKHDNELIGRAAITLKSIPVSGLTVWYNLEKGSKTKSRGSLLVHLALSAEKNKHVAIQEHRHLLKLLLMHELETSKVAHYWWSGKFHAKAEIIRSQHAVQSGLTQFEVAISQWSVYATIHEDHPLSFSLFNSILDILIPTLKCLQEKCDDLKTFWDGARRLLPSCFSVLRKVRSKNVSDRHIIKTLCEVLDIISKIADLEESTDIDLFPKNVYGWISREDESQKYEISNAIADAINSGTNEWLEHIIEGNKPTSSNQTDEDNLQYLIKLIQMVRSDLQRAIEYFDKHFYQKTHINYSSMLYKFYDAKLTEISKSIVVDTCANIKRLNVPDDQCEQLPNIDDVNMGTTLFELYLILKRFLMLGKQLCPNDGLSIETFYLWFMPGVTHWLDISIIKALTRIQKAIELDKLKAVDETVKYSSSAVDTLAIFYQIKIFWQQLDWPDAEGSYTFVAKIVDDICRCCVFYAQKMSRRVEQLGNNSEPFNVTTEWCLAINNIDYIRQSLPAFIKVCSIFQIQYNCNFQSLELMRGIQFNIQKELGADDVIRKLSEFRSSLEAERCTTTIKNVIDNALDTERNQILELIDVVARKMAPPIRRFLAEGAEVLHEDSNSMEKLMMYLEQSLGTLYEALNEVNFGRILDAIWTELSVIMYDLIQSNLDKRRPPAFFQNLRQTLRVMISCFKMGNIVTSDIEVLTEIERILDLHAFETAELIHQYYLERMGHQKETQKSEYGLLTIKAKFTDTGLELNIMNARNLKPMDTNGSCDPFVKAHFMPTNRFVGVAAVKTAIQSKTRYPLFDETFNINLTEEQRTKQNNLILFSIKDTDLFGMSKQYIAECYITFADIMASDNEQIHMELSRPEYSDSDTIRALEYRQGDKQAKDFLKKLKSKSFS